MRARHWGAWGQRGDIFRGAVRVGDEVTLQSACAQRASLLGVTVNTKRLRMPIDTHVVTYGVVPLALPLGPRSPVNAGRLT